MFDTDNIINIISHKGKKHKLFNNSDLSIIPTLKLIDKIFSAKISSVHQS